MFARHNQENLTHTHLTTAAAKPLNTHLPKTPFRSRNDENASLTVAAKGGPAPLFTTPATTRARPALGAKTANAKALATPGPNGAKTQKPIPASTQKISPRLKRTKVKIHAPVSETVDAEDDVPDVEYCPPPGVVTPPLEWREDGFEEIIASDLCTREHVLRSAMSSDTWDSGQIESAREREDALQRRMEEALNQELERDATTVGQLGFEEEQESGRAVSKMSERKGVSTLNARTAASLLGARKTPSFAAPTASTRSRVEATGTGKENVNDRFTGAKALSKTTMGYSRGRQVSATKRAPLSNAHRTPVVKVAPKKEDTKARKLEDVVKPTDGNDERERNWVDEEIERLACEDFVLEL